MTTLRPLLAAAIISAIGLCACGGTEATSVNDADTTPIEAAEATGIRVTSPTDAAATIADPPADLVILDVRTQEEFDDGHIEGAMILDFYRDDFAEQLALLDPDVPYVLYCRSGNRSGQTRTIMSELGFESVQDVDGGVLEWQQAGLPLIAE